MSKKAAQSNWWTQFRNLIKTNTSLTIIVVAALLLELSTGVLYYFAQNIIERTVQRLMDREMNAISLSIRNQMAKVEVTVENMAWVVTDDLADPDSLLRLTYQLVEHNPAIMGSSVSCVPYYFPQEGRLYEPYSVRRSDGTIESMQLGSPHHDYTQMEFYQIPISTGRGHWCEPYWDKEGAKMKITTYGMPVRDSHGKIAAVVDADLSLDWLDHVVNQGRVYSSTKRFLVTGRHNLLAGEQGPLFNVALEQLKQLSVQTDYVVMKGDDGKKKHVYFLNVGGQTDWILINVLDDDAVFGKLRRMRISLLLPLMIGLIFAGFIVYRSSRNLERLRRVNAEKERIGGELRVASMIQQSMLPRNDLHQDDVNICGTQEPAREVGGDLFDYFIRDEKLYFLIGDVSGKGAPSAMLMAVTHALFRSASAHDSNPGHIMQTLNETLCQGNDSNMFVTIFIGVLDLPTGHLRYCNAGHDVPYVIHDSHYSVLDCHPNIPVGVFDDKKYGVQQMEMSPDSTIFLYTDGLAEAMDKEHQQFGMTRIEAVLDRCAKDQLKPQQILKIFNEQVHQFVGEDDGILFKVLPAHHYFMAPAERGGVFFKQYQRASVALLGFPASYYPTHFPRRGEVKRKRNGGAGDKQVKESNFPRESIRFRDRVLRGNSPRHHSQAGGYSHGRYSPYPEEWKNQAKVTPCQEQHPVQPEERSPPHHQEVKSIEQGQIQPRPRDI